MPALRMYFADVILPLPLEGSFTYVLPPELETRARVGCRVQVPLGKNRHYMGIICRLHHDQPPYATKAVTDLPDENPVVLPAQLEFWQWMADYHICTLGEVMKTALPPGMDGRYRPKTEDMVRPAYQEGEAEQWLQQLAKAPRQQLLLQTYLQMAGPTGTAPVDKLQLLRQAGCNPNILLALRNKGVLEVFASQVGRLRHDVSATEPPHALTVSQRRALDEIKAVLAKKSTCLLHGATSSGKTEIYIHLIDQCIKAGQQVLYLLPEIAITTQVTSRLQKVFGDKLGIYHSKFSDAERVEIWQKQLSDDPYPVILGVRSALFLPLQRPGLIIVDEEQDASYKQQTPAPRYLARNTALMLAQMVHAKTLLGTATPSIETWYNATEGGKYGLVELKERYRDAQPPRIIPVDLKDLHHRRMMKGPFSPLLLDYMHQALDAGRQVILLQNRRGFAPLVECHHCGWVPRCKQCDVSLTYHKESGKLTCHYCGFSMPMPAVCPECGQGDLRSRGVGTEKVEELVRDLFPDHRVARLDMDTARSRGDYEEILRDFEQGRTHILIGTQMVSKGLDFDRVQVVGVLNADTMLNYPDFRAHERTYQLIAQVAGRAGRKDGRGVVVLQTRHTDSPIVAQVVNGRFEDMVSEQLEERKLFHYPPYYRLIYIFCRHADESVAQQMAAEMTQRLAQHTTEQVLGPVKPVVAKVQNVYLRQIVLKVDTGTPPGGLRKVLVATQKQVLSDPRFKQGHIYYNVDPL